MGMERIDGFAEPMRELKWILKDNQVPLDIYLTKNY